MTTVNRPPFTLAREWYCYVGGKLHGPWPLKAYAEAGYATELRRALNRELPADKQAEEQRRVILRAKFERFYIENCFPSDDNHEMYWSIFKAGADAVLTPEDLTPTLVNEVDRDLEKRIDIMIETMKQENAS